MFSGIPQTDQQTFDKTVAVHTVLDLASYNNQVLKLNHATNY